MFQSMIQNYWTTILGGIAGAGQYLATVGPKAPSTRGEWFSFIVGLVLAVFGLVAKDATTGSKP